MPEHHRHHVVAAGAERHAYAEFVPSLTYALIALLLFAVAGAAAYLPAYRATRVDPARALRED